MRTVNISKREKEILSLIAYEHNSKQIARELFISEHTVISHRKNLMHKMDVKNTAGLVRKAFAEGFLRLNSISLIAILILGFNYNLWSQACTVDIIHPLDTDQPKASVSKPIAIGSGMIYTQYDTTTGTELWRTTGAFGQEAIVKDIYKGEDSSNPIHLYPLGGELVLFFAYLPDLGIELWKTDGTANGTSLLKDMIPGEESALDNSLAEQESAFLGVYDGLLYFVIRNAGSYELWRTDGTSIGTVVVEEEFFTGISKFDDIVIISAPIGGIVFYIDGSTNKMFYSNGTLSSTYILDESIDDAVRVGDTIYY